MEGIKSKERVKQHGEVFTPDSIVNDMLDLTDKGLDTEDIWKYIDTTYLEPSCGNGNFLVRILDRKLEKVQKLPKDQQELALLHAVSSIYAVDIQKDNVEESRERLLNLIKTGTTELLELPDKEKLPFHFEKIELSEELEKSIKLILENNIMHGNMLTCKQYEYINGNMPTGNDLVFCEYTWNNNLVQVDKYNFTKNLAVGTIIQALSKQLGSTDYHNISSLFESSTINNDGYQEEDDDEF